MFNQIKKIQLKLRKNRSKNQKKEYSESYDESANIQEDSRQQTESKPPSRIVQKNHPENQIIGDKNKGVQTRRKLIKASEQSHIAFLSMMERNNF